MYNDRRNPTSLDEEVLFGHLSVQRRLGLRIKHQILQINHQPGSSQTPIRPKARTRDGEKRNPDLQRGLGGDGLVRGGEEREAHGLVALEVDLGSLEPREPAQQVVELPLLDVEGEPRDEDGADLVGRGGAGRAGHGGRRRDGRRGGRPRRGRRGRRGRPLLVERVDAGAGHGGANPSSGE